MIPLDRKKQYPEVDFRSSISPPKSESHHSLSIKGEPCLTYVKPKS
jgi:hypothetical protein